MSALPLRERFDLRRFSRGEKAVDGPVKLNHRRIFILPYQRGLGLGVLLLILILVATNYNNNLSFILCFLLAGIGLLSTFYSYRNLAGLNIRANRAEPVFAGSTAVFPLLLENPTRQPRFSVNLNLHNGTSVELDLPAEIATPAALTLTAQRRGWLNMPTVTVSTVFPLGVHRAWSPLNLKQRLLVYPQPSSAMLPFPEAPGEQGGKDANADDFHGFHAYQPGDSLRRIHWKAVARGQGVMVKEYRGEPDETVYLDWNVTPGPDIEARLSQLCRWVIDAEQAGMLYGLRLPGIDLAPASGQDHYRRCLETLALWHL
jgi:uncharacterized protein (DUF58 family)